MIIFEKERITLVSLKQSFRYKNKEIQNICTYTFILNARFKQKKTTLFLYLFVRNLKLLKVL